MDAAAPVVAVVVAAGAGTRLGGSTPKALREVCGRSLVRHSLDALAAGGVSRAVVVILAGDEAAFETALADSPIPAGYIRGGARRQDSVRAGLEALAGDPLAAPAVHVLVHDAARPAVPSAVVERVIAALRDGAAAVIPVVPVVDSIREVTARASVVVDRTGLRCVQTPQGFVRSVLADALSLADERGLEVTDDASAVEGAGGRVTLVEGSRDALKVTEPVDLALVEAVFRSRP